MNIRYTEDDKTVQNQLLGERESCGEADLGLSLSWSSDTGRCVDASPVLLVQNRADHRSDLFKATVFIGSHSHRIQALDVATGNLMWERVLGDRIEASAAVSHCGALVVIGKCQLCEYLMFRRFYYFIFLYLFWGGFFLRMLWRLCVFFMHWNWKDTVGVWDGRCCEELSCCGSSHWSGGSGLTRWVRLRPKLRGECSMQSDTRTRMIQKSHRLMVALDTCLTCLKQTLCFLFSGSEVCLEVSLWWRSCVFFSTSSRVTPSGVRGFTGRTPALSQHRKWRSFCHLVHKWK